VVTRAGDERVAAAVTQPASRVRARNLSKAETEQYLLHIMGGVEIPSFVLDHVHEACGGHIYSIQLLYQQLLELKIVVRDDENQKRHWFPPAWYEADAWPSPGPPPFPPILVGLWLSRMEQLPQFEQDVLKSAALISTENEKRSNPSFSILQVLEAMDSTAAAVEMSFHKLVVVGILLKGIFDDSAPGGAEDACRFEDETWSDCSVIVQPSTETQQMYAFVSKMLRNVIAQQQLEAGRKSQRRKMQRQARAMSSKLAPPPIASKLAVPPIAGIRQPLG